MLRYVRQNREKKEENKLQQPKGLMILGKQQLVALGKQYTRGQCLESYEFVVLKGLFRDRGGIVRDERIRSQGKGNRIETRPTLKQIPY